VPCPRISPYNVYYLPICHQHLPDRPQAFAISTIPIPACQLRIGVTAEVWIMRVLTRPSNGFARVFRGRRNGFSLQWINRQKQPGNFGNY